MGFYMFSVVPVIILIGFIIVFGILIVAGIKGFGEWRANNAAEVITEPVVIKDKRYTSKRHHHNNHMNVHHTYFITFEFVDKERLELKVKESQYGFLSVNDTGQLTYQRKRFIDFERDL